MKILFLELILMLELSCQLKNSLQVLFIDKNINLIRIFFLMHFAVFVSILVEPR